MCGIAGGMGKDCPDQISLDRQLDILKHRGPDGVGKIFGKDFSLGMCRLAIVEIQNGTQPSSDSLSKIHLVFNGEIYNFKDLQKKYFQNSRTLRNNSEATLLVELYKLMGTDFINLLDGMFAIALYDEEKDFLLLARDKLGKKPLFYSIISEKSIVFASETKAILAVIPTKNFSHHALSEFMMFGYLTGERTAFVEVKSIPPAHFGIYSRGELKIKEYWKPNYNSILKISYQEAKEETRRLLTESIEKRLISERPIGVFLSGGVDSTLVAALLSRIHPGDFKTFTIGFNDSNIDESTHASKIARYLGLKHEIKIVEPNSQILINDITNVLDQPFADTSVIPTFELARYAANEIVVAIGGDGGDEVFGGYTRYLTAQKIQKISQFLKFLDPLSQQLVKRNLITNPKLSRLLIEAQSRSTLSSAYLSVMSRSSSELFQKLLSSDYLRSEPATNFIDSFENEGAKDPLSSMLRSDLTTYLPGDLLVKADMASMANGLELRSPLLDIKLIEWANSLPSTFKIQNNRTKYILKDLVGDLIPLSILEKPKMGFGIPRASWLRTEFKELSYDLLTDGIARDRGWFNQKCVQNLLDSHQGGLDRSSIIWPMLMLELWARRWLDY
jgi:asparagine synthase (glutamine-hydrolysing)